MNTNVFSCKKLHAKKRESNYKKACKRKKRVITTKHAKERRE